MQCPKCKTEIEVRSTKGWTCRECGFDDKQFRIEQLEVLLAAAKLKWQVGCIPADGWYWYCWHNPKDGKRYDIRIRVEREGYGHSPESEWAGPIQPPEEY